jgi:hypothetical protein
MEFLRRIQAWEVANSPRLPGGFSQFGHIHAIARCNIYPRCCSHMQFGAIWTRGVPSGSLRRLNDNPAQAEKKTIENVPPGNRGSFVAYGLFAEHTCLAHCSVADQIVQCSRDNEVTEQTGTVYVCYAGYNSKTGSKLLETRPIRSSCAKTVPAEKLTSQLCSRAPRIEMQQQFS